MKDPEILKQQQTLPVKSSNHISSECEIAEAADVLESMDVVASNKGAGVQSVARESPRASSLAPSEGPTPAAARKRKSAAPSTSRGKRSRLTTVDDELRDELASSAVILPPDEPKQAEFRVMFTGLDEDDTKKERAILLSLGAELVDNISECTHLITDKVNIRESYYLGAADCQIPFRRIVGKAYSLT